MKTVITSAAADPAASRATLLRIAAFWLFSYVLLSLWGSLVVGNLGMVLNLRRLVLCSIGAGIFWFALDRLGRRRDVGIGTLLSCILGAGMAILAIRFSLDQMSSTPVEPEMSVRWSLAWSGYFGIWLLAAVPPAPPGPVEAASDLLPDVYLDHLLDFGDDRPA